MNIVISPNAWSCLPAAFATATGVPFETLLENIGHDGSEIVFEDRPDPECRRAFTSQEVAIALLDYGFLVGTFESYSSGCLDETHQYELDHSDVVRRIMNDSIGVLGVVVKSTENLHAVAWDGLRCYDPTGFIYPLDSYRVQVYYRLGRC